MTILVTFASWEDRFRDGSLRILAERSPSKVLMYYFDGYAAASAGNRETVDRYCQQHQILAVSSELRVTDPAENWATLRRTVMEHVLEKSTVVVDFSTMPREVIWTIFWLLELKGAAIDYVYHRPEGYGSWLSRDPQGPRLVYKMSGLSKLGRRTALIVMAGYDVERTQQLVTFFEPEVTLLGVQDRDWDAESENRMRRHRERFGSDSSVETFIANAFSGNHGEEAIAARIEHYRGSHNIVMSSLGPKPSAVALYRLRRRYPEVGLAYAPSREFNLEYSTGLGKAITGLL